MASVEDRQTRRAHASPLSRRRRQRRLPEPGQHVTTIRLGRGQHELDAAVEDRAGAIFTDSMEQLRSYPDGFFLAHRIDTITELSEGVARGAPVRSSPDEITLYLSAGLAGTEVADLALVKVESG